MYQPNAAIFRQQQGVAAQGHGTQVHLVHCLITGHMESCVAAINGGSTLCPALSCLQSLTVLQAIFTSSSQR